MAAARQQKQKVDAMAAARQKSQDCDCDCGRLTPASVTGQHTVVVHQQRTQDKTPATPKIRPRVSLIVIIGDCRGSLGGQEKVANTSSMFGDATRTVRVYS